jgi:hypothetical protein
MCCSPLSSRIANCWLPNVLYISSHLLLTGATNKQCPGPTELSTFCSTPISSSGLLQFTALRFGARLSTITEEEQGCGAAAAAENTPNKFAQI